MSQGVPPELLGEFASKLGVQYPAAPASVGAAVPSARAIGNTRPLTEYGGDQNALGQPLSQASSAIAPPQPAASGPMVPVRNASGQVIGEEPANKPPLFNFSMGPSPETLAAGGPRETIGKDAGKTAKDIKDAEKAEAKVDKDLGGTVGQAGLTSASVPTAPPLQYHAAGWDQGRV